MNDFVLLADEQWCCLGFRRSLEKPLQAVAITKPKPQKRELTFGQVKNVFARRFYLIPRQAHEL